MNAWLGQSLPWAHRSHLTTCLQHDQRTYRIEFKIHTYSDAPD
ncbi:hypothetical protein [Leptolyngbya sp. O-77]|nr:hypothetical protein [Leptolyngbya sp. O-77]